MKKIIILFVLVLFIINTKAQGLIFDSTEFNKREKIEETRAELPSSASLKMYTPILYPQIGSTCVAHAFANARTILLAKSLGWTDKEKVTSLSFSPYYIYYRSKSFDDIGCTSGISVGAAGSDVLSNGFAPMSDVEYADYYPFTKNVLCIDEHGTSFPRSMSEVMVDAEKFKIDNIYTVSTIRQLKTALAAGMPVIACMYAPASFPKVRSDIWMPQITDRFNKNNGHALLVIGYDDNKYGGALELMNSWGESWGNKGFTWIKYTDYLKWFLGGYAFYIEDSPRLKSANNSPFTPTKAAISPKIMKVKRGLVNDSTTFNNTKFIKAFAGK